MRKGDLLLCPEMRIQFADYAAWQRKLFQDGLLEEEHGPLEKKLLLGTGRLLELPADRRRPATQSFRGAVRALELNTKTTSELLGFSSRHGITLFVTMLTAFKVLLHRLTYREDMVAGTAVANRPLAVIESLIGMIVSSLVMRMDLSGNPTLQELLERVRDMTFEMFKHEDAPFEALVRRVHTQRTMSHNPLFQVMFSFHDSELSDPQAGDIFRTRRIQGQSLLKFDLGCAAMPHFAQSTGKMTAGANDRITMEWEYNTDLFDSLTIDRMMSRYYRVLQTLITKPSTGSKWKW